MASIPFVPPQKEEQPHYIELPVSSQKKHNYSLMLEKASHLPAAETEFFGAPSRRSPTGLFLFFTNENEN